MKTAQVLSTKTTPGEVFRIEISANGGTAQILSTWVTLGGVSRIEISGKGRNMCPPASPTQVSGVVLISAPPLRGDSIQGTPTAQSGMSVSRRNTVGVNPCSRGDTMGSPIGSRSRSSRASREISPNRHQEELNLSLWRIHGQRRLVQSLTWLRNQ